MRKLALFMATMAACAQAGPAAPDSAGVIVADAEATGGRIDADLGAPDATPRIDAPPAPDAMPHVDASPPDAAPPPPPDAMPGTPDAAPLPPDAMPACTPTPMNILANGNFEAGTGSWTQTSTGGFGLIVTGADLGGVAANDGAWAVWMGGYTSGTDTLLQAVTVPAGVTELRLRGYRIVGTTEDPGETTAWDTVNLQIRNSGGTVLQTLATWSNLTPTAAWTMFDYALPTSYAGQTIQIFITATNDSISHSNFFFDTLTLDATTCI